MLLNDLMYWDVNDHGRVLGLVKSGVAVPNELVPMPSAHTWGGYKVIGDSNSRFYECQGTYTAFP